MKKAVRLFYIIYTLYMILFCSITSLSLSKVIVSLVLLWIVYFAFSAGFGKEQKIFNTQAKESLSLLGVNCDSVTWLRIVLIAGMSLLLAVVCAKFYTGMTPIRLISNLRNGVSSYQNYQRYFATMELGKMTIRKLPIALLMGLNRTLFYFSFISLTVSGRIKRFKSIVYLFIISMGHIYFGLARGTNFEMYQLFTLCAFCYILYHVKNNKRINYVLLFILGVIMVCFFLVMLKNRGHSLVLEPTIKNRIFLNYESLIVRKFPVIVIAVEYVFGYLGYGLYYITVMMIDVMASTAEGLLDFFIPITDSLTQTSVLANIQVNWLPDLADYIDSFGFIAVFALLILFGRALRFLGVTDKYSDLFYVMVYFAFMQMISFPIGNFLHFSSELIAILFTVSLILFGKRIRIRVGMYSFSITNKNTNYSKRAINE